MAEANPSIQQTTTTAHTRNECNRWGRPRYGYRIFNAATNAVEATDEADDENYFAVLDQAGNAAEAAAAEITG